jgi:signal-transduction protein with cAMP-binding, CBS, and nucleotidyltransferase domain
MMCPRCECVNLPGVDECVHCLFPLASLDIPTGHDRVEDSILHDTIVMLKPRKPVIIEQHQTLGIALQHIVDAEVGSALIVNKNGTLVGILTERDFLTRVPFENQSFLNQPLYKFMTRDPETVRDSDFLGVALYKMDSGSYRHLAVVNEFQEPVGIISVRDVIRHITRLCKEP